MPNDELPSSLLLPMGRMGPAFLAYPNFAAYTEWNNSLIYSTTAGYLATRIAGAPPMRRPSAPIAQLPFNEIRELQQLLVRAGFTVGKIDGVLGQQSRSAIKAMQIKYRPAGGFLAHRRIVGADARGNAARATRRNGFACPRAEGPMLSTSRPRKCFAGTTNAFAFARGSDPKGSCLEYLSLDRLHKSCISLSPHHFDGITLADPISPPRKSITCPYTTLPFRPSCRSSAASPASSARPRRIATTKNVQPDVLLGARLYPDMLPLSRQIQLVCDFAAKTSARLTQSDVPSTPDTEKTFDELKARLARTADYVKAFKPAQFDGADGRDVSFPAGPDKTMTLKGQQFLSHFALPNFYFHAATAHDILRHNGVEIGKRDFLGAS